MMSKEAEKATDHSELEKAQGDTPSQQEIRAYHEGAFQTTDPVTGLPRDTKIPAAPEPVATESKPKKASK